MNSFAYSRATDVADAVTKAGKPETRLLAGGTTLVDLMKLGVELPKAVIDINRVPLAQIEVADKGVRIGAMARNTDVAYHAEIQKRDPAMAAAYEKLHRSGRQTC